MAREREQENKDLNKQIIKKQVLIMIIVCCIVCVGGNRKKYLELVSNCYSSNPTSEEAKVCLAFEYTICISSAVGFLFIGNLYDNSIKPNKLTLILLAVLAVISLFQGLFSTTKQLYNNPDYDNSTFLDSNTTLYQISAVFEAGLIMACLVVL